MFPQEISPLEILGAKRTLVGALVGVDATSVQEQLRATYEGGTALLALVRLFT